ncbi:MAG: biotin carboxylase N-terminal domain-containing protein [Gammaproteobacteria bacterium]
MFQRILIANRGEIACRIIDTCRRLGIATVAVYSDADNRARHVRMADACLPIGPAPAADSYLDAERIVGAALDAGAEAIHPGYGFLAENADFAEACRAAGLVFIGPRTSTIRRMGSKRAAKEIMDGAGVPVIPGVSGVSDVAGLRRCIESLGLPVLLKPSAGGGGKGMRVVHDAAELDEAWAAARREAKAAFGDDEIIVEKFIERPRHIEVQIFGDEHGNLVHLFERECSMQRRQQKILEETPAPGLTRNQRDALYGAALAAGRAVGYVNAGTVEFMLDDGGHFHFLEMNTRLQVEHPVTERTTGLDLVEWQLRVASGEALPLAQGEIRSRGHAIEARIYAEDPGRDFLPSTGAIEVFDWPRNDPLVRMDTGYEAGDTIERYYDPLVAKLVASGPDRDSALTHLQNALAECILFGPRNNLAFLRRLVRTPAFVNGTADTAFVDRELGGLTRATPVPDNVLLAAAAAVMRRRQGESAGDHNPWASADAWRARPEAGTTLAFATAAGERRLRARGGPQRFAIAIGDEPDWRRVRLIDTGCRGLVLEIDDDSRAVHLACTERRVQVTVDRETREFDIADPWATDTTMPETDAHPVAPMPGRVVALFVQENQRVAEGDRLLVLEGMKMEFTLRAGTGGRIVRLHVGEGDFVEADAVLVDIEPEAGSADEAE